MVIIAEDSNIRIERLELGPWGTNAYIAICLQTMDCVLIDAPAEANKIMDRLQGTNPRYILLTHNHMDHIGALSELQHKLKVPVAGHPADFSKLPSTPEVRVADGNVVSFGKVEIEVLHTPGHTPGSLCFRIGNYLISGDTLFSSGPGKTNSPADFRQIIESITDKIFLLPDDTEVFPGHGEATALSKEKQEFAVFTSRRHAPDFCGHVLWLSS